MKAIILNYPNLLQILSILGLVSFASAGILELPQSYEQSYIAQPEHYNVSWTQLLSTWIWSNNVLASLASSTIRIPLWCTRPSHWWPQKPLWSPRRRRSKGLLLCCRTGWYDQNCSLHRRSSYWFQCYCGKIRACCSSLASYSASNQYCYSCTCRRSTNLLLSLEYIYYTKLFRFNVEKNKLLFFLILVLFLTGIIEVQIRNLLLYFLWTRTKSYRSKTFFTIIG